MKKTVIIVLAALFGISALMSAWPYIKASVTGGEYLAPAIVNDVDWSVRNEADYANQGSTMVTVLNLRASIKNDSPEEFKPNELPVLTYGGNVVPLTENSIASSRIEDVHVRLTFDEAAGPYEFKFETVEGKRPFEGLEGVAEKITEEYNSVHSELPQAIADREAERRAREEERKAQQEQATQATRERTVWVLGDSDTYHTDPNCYHIRNKGATAMTLEEAVERGCTACGHCRRA